MSDSTLNRFLARGTNAARIAFTPSPPTPASGPSPGYIWYATDTSNTYAWDGAAWQLVNNASGSVTTTGSPASGNLTKFSGAASITNGDLSGDVTTSGTLVTAIGNDKVTYAKMQDVSATKRLVGRNTAGSGDPEEVTVEQVFSWISGTPAQGDVFYRDGSGVARLAAGTSGQFLKTQGSGANPVWASASTGAWALAGTGQTATGVYDFAVDGAKANIDFAGLSAYNELLIIAQGLSNGTSGQRCLRVSVDNGATFFAASGDYKVIDANGVETSAVFFGGHSTNSTAARTFISQILNLKGAVKASVTQLTGFTQFLFTASASDINAVRVLNLAGGNMTAGTVRVYAR